MPNAMAPPVPNLPRAPSAPTTAPSLKDIVKTTRKLPSRIILHSGPGWGKTSFAAQTPSPIVLCTRGEDGLESLIDTGQIPPTDHFPGTFQTWNHLTLALLNLVVEKHPYRSVIVDTVNGAQQLAVEYLQDKKYDGDFDKLDAYGRGGQRTLALMIELTNILDRLREKDCSVLLLAHSTVKTFKNPQGLDFPKWEMPLYKEVQEHFERWADAILFGDLETFATSKDKNAQKGKASGGEQRILRCQPSACYTAKNRLGLPAEIPCGSSAAEAWNNFLTTIKAAKPCQPTNP